MSKPLIAQVRSVLMTILIYRFARAGTSMLITISKAIIGLAGFGVLVGFTDFGSAIIITLVAVWYLTSSA